MKQTKRGVATFTLALAIFWIALTGSGLLKLFAGASPLDPAASLADASGRYVAYDVTHPVVSYPESYYSGDPDRVRQRAYITYDADRQAFLKIVIGEHHKSSYEQLMWAANMSDDLRESWGEQLESKLRPVSVTGSLMPLTEQADIQKILDAITGPDSECNAAMAAALLALGIYVTGTLMDTLTCYLPLGLILGELFGITTLLSIGLTYDAEHILVQYQQRLVTGFVSADERDAIVSDLLNAEDQWSVLETGKEEALHAIAGARYWASLEGNTNLSIIDSERVEKITSEKRAGMIRTGKVRTSYTFYVVAFFFRNSQTTAPDAQIVFHNEEAVGHFLTLLRRRLGDQAAAIMQ